MKRRPFKPGQTPLFQRLRKERKELYPYCEYGGVLCVQEGRRLECHHVGPESYRKEEAGTLTIDDIRIICDGHHGAITNWDRTMRYASRKLPNPPTREAIADHFDRKPPTDPFQEFQSDTDSSNLD